MDCTVCTNMREHTICTEKTTTMQSLGSKKLLMNHYHDNVTTIFRAFKENF